MKIANRGGATEYFGTMPLPRLLFSMAMPAIIANVFNSLYNIVDQIFIGHGVGYLGNAATGIAFPLTTICLAFGLMCGIGGAANFNLSMGRGEIEKAKKIIGNAISLSVMFGLVVAVIVLLFLEPLMLLFGATDATLGYAMEYTRITALGLPFLMFTIAANSLVRADGSPVTSMLAVIIGAVLNTMLDPLFIFVFHWGIAGAALATTISQIVSALYFALYFRRFRSMRLDRDCFRLSGSQIKVIATLGSSSFIFQISNMAVQILTNNMLRTHGEQSIYGSDIALAVAGIVLKLNAIFIAVIIGVVQGAQPILGYNYGAKQYARVRETVRLMLTFSFVISLIAFIGFEVFPATLLAIFGEGSALYFEFGTLYIRVFLLLTIVNGVQIASTTFFQAIGKAGKGALLSLLKQVIILLPLLLILPRFFGVYGVIYAGPIVDLIAFITAGVLLLLEMKTMKQLETA
ncbi:MAG: MATE family efflux transporter [Eubacteriales bacterium]|nr:MATE family efflux transporter [Eubacteriales bacterium]